jgi:hypothetical protein
LFYKENSIFTTPSHHKEPTNRNSVNPKEESMKGNYLRKMRKGTFQDSQRRGSRKG